MKDEPTSNGINNLAWCKIKQRIIRYKQQEDDPLAYLSFDEWQRKKKKTVGAST